MKTRIDATVLEVIAKAVEADLISLLNEYQASDKSFADFKHIWKSLRFSCIHHACPEKLHYGVYLQMLFDSALNLIGISAEDDHSNEQTAVVFLLYCLHQTQLHGDRPLMPIFISMTQLAALQSSILSSMNPEATRILATMLRSRSFLLSAYSGPQCVYYAEKHKNSVVDSFQVTLQPFNILEQKDGETVAAVGSSSKQSNADADDADVITKLEELVPARRAHKRLMLEAEREKRRKRQAAEAKRLNDTLSRMSQPRATRKVQSRITLETVATVQAPISTATNSGKGDSSVGKKSRRGYGAAAGSLEGEQASGFDESTFRNSRSSDATKPRKTPGKKQQPQESHMDNNNSSSNSLVDDLEEMIRLSGESIPRPPPRRKRKEPQQSDTASGVAVASAAAGDTSSSAGANKTASGKKAKTSATDSKSKRKAVSSKKADTASAETSTAGKKSTKLTNKAVGGKQSTSSDTPIIQLLEQLEKDTAEALSDRRSSKKRSRRRSADSDPAMGPVGDSESSSVLAMVESLERDSTEALKRHSRRKGSNTRQRKSVVTKQRAASKTDARDTQIQASILSTGSIAAAASSEGVSTVLDMLQELEKDTSSVLEKGTKRKASKRKLS